MAETDADTLALERDLTNLFGLKVGIKFRGGGGALIIHYGSLDQLDDILHRLSHEPHGAGPPGAAPDPAEATDGITADVPGPLPETAAEAPPEIPEDSEDSGGPAGEGADGAGESPSSTGGEEPAGETGGAAEEPPSGGPAVGDNGGPASDRPDDPTATDMTE